MARPKKDTVDYFPHTAKHGKTIFTLESLFGNDGYACWFKVLEVLASSNGHYYDMRGDSEKLYLYATFKVDFDKGEKILSMIADLGAIDKELFLKGIIWSDNFIDNITAVYSKRNTETPLKPSFRDGKLVFVTETRQSRVEDSKVDYIIQIPLKDDSVFSLLEEDFNLFKDTYSSIDVLKELKKCKAWNQTNKNKRKTLRGIKKHINSWLSRANDKSPEKDKDGWLI